ncbi:efflux RND transporter permease subunit [Burkholderia ambifaria]|uniref:efflux RND transporter permease subunit n=1 Tax=Burkholderia ambifaria TaxID=152480 RepID=UPI003CEE5827
MHINAPADTIADINDLPIQTVNGATTYLREVASVRDGFAPQTNVVRQNGQRGVLMSILKTGDASTLKIIDQVVKAKLPKDRRRCPKALTISALGGDQSVFVNAAVQGVIHEALIAAVLTAMMILLFLGNWRSTLIIAISIPLSIFTSLIALSALGETINIMTLGGLALAVGILVDDATVTIENIERHLERGTQDVHDAILEGAGEIAVPAFVSTLCICIVFVPMFFLTGVARFLFVPLAEAVVFAMLASYVLSRTLVPTLAMLLFRPQQAGTGPDRSTSRFARIHSSHSSGAFERRFAAVRTGYRAVLGLAAGAPRASNRAVLPHGFCRAWRIDRPRVRARPRLLPERRFRQHPAAPARAHRLPDRGNRSPHRPRRSARSAKP